MATQTYDSNNAAFVRGGDKTEGYPICQWDFQFTGTDLEISIGINTGSVKVTIDGGAPSTIPASSTGYLSLASGLSDTSHSVTVVPLSTYPNPTGTFRVTGSAPAVSAPADFGPTYDLFGQVSSDYIRVDGAWFNFLSRNQATCTNPGSGITFRTDASEIWLYSAGQARLYCYIDGSTTLTEIDTTNSPGGWVQILSGLDTSSVHKYEFHRAVGGGGEQIVISQIQLRGGNGLSTSQVVPSRRSFVGFGDSIPGTNDPVEPTGVNMFPRVALALDMAYAWSSAAGVGVASTGISNATNLAAPDITALLGGTNDYNAGTSVSTFQTAYDAKVDEYRGYYPSSKIICNKLFLRYNARSPSADDIEDYRAAIQSVVDADVGGGDTNIFALNTKTWTALGTTDYQDNLHFKDAGHAIVANRLIPIVAATAFSTSGTTGTVTVTLAGGATFTGDQKITVSTSAGNITATASGGTILNNGTGTVDITPMAGATSFTLTGSADGTISFTNDQDAWANPGAISYTSGTPTPATPTSFAITAIDATGITVGFTGSANAGSFTDLTYQIERSTNGTDFTLLTYITGTSYKDTTTVNGVTYYYRVYASSAEFGESAVTDSDSGVAQGPVGLPTVVSASATAFALKVRFSEEVAGVVVDQWTLNTGHTLTSATGNGSGGLIGTVWTFVIDPDLAVEQGDVLTLDYAGTSAKNDLNALVATFSGRAVANRVGAGTSYRPGMGMSLGIGLGL